MAMLNPYIFFRRQPLEHLEKLDATRSARKSGKEGGTEDKAQIG